MIRERNLLGRSPSCSIMLLLCFQLLQGLAQQAGSEQEGCNAVSF